MGGTGLATCAGGQHAAGAQLSRGDARGSRSRIVAAAVHELRGKAMA